MLKNSIVLSIHISLFSSHVPQNSDNERDIVAFIEAVLGGLYGSANVTFPREKAVLMNDEETASFFTVLLTCYQNFSLD